MAKEIIVGGGLCGLLLARERIKRGKEVEGFEPSERLGGRFLSGAPRILETKTTQRLAELVEGLECTPREGQPKSRKKGAWGEVAGDFPSQEQHLLNANYFWPNKRPQELLDSLTSEVAGVFHLRRRVVEVDPEQKRVTCDDGSAWEYEQLFWTGGLDDLRKASTEALPVLDSALKNLAPAHGGLCLDWELTAPLFEGHHTVVFPFRFKDWKLRALGVPGSWEDGHSLHWYVFLEEELLEDREEVAKCVRALKRELGKEFEGAKESVVSEKLSYFPVLATEKPATLESLQVAPGLWYMGAEAGLAGENGEPPANLDLLLSNFVEVRAQLPSGEA